MAPKTGWFVFAEKGSVLVHIWSEAEERYLPETHGSIDKEQVRQLKVRCSAMQLDEVLAAYPMQQGMQWASLCHAVTRGVLEEVLPVGGSIRPGTPPVAAAAAAAANPEIPGALPTGGVDGGAGSNTGGADPQLDMLRVRQLQVEAGQLDGAPSAGQRFFFTTIPGTGHACGSAWRTAYGVDPSGCLVQAAGAAGGAQQLLAQLQVAFLAFALGESLQAYIAWKHLFAAFARAEWLLTDAYGSGCSSASVPAGIAGGAPLQCPEGAFTPSFLAQVLATMAQQVQLLPDEFSAEDLTPSSFVRLVDKRLRGTLARHGAQRSVQLAPYKPNTHCMQEQVERSARLLLACTRKHLAFEGAQLDVARGSAVASAADPTSARLTADEVLSILGEDWDGDEGDDLPVVVDVDSGMAIS